MKIKVCGIKHPTNMQDVATLKPNYLGFIFFERSPRFMENTLSKDDLANIPSEIKKTGVFVNHTKEEVAAKVHSYQLNAIQLHGDESPEYCASFKNKGVEVIKVFRVGDDFDFSILEKYSSVVDYFLFDTKGKSYGGNGIAFDWEILKKYPYDIPFFLSGGIKLEDATVIKHLELPQLYAVDINSGFEEKPGLKNIPLLHQFFKEL